MFCFCVQGMVICAKRRRPARRVVSDEKDKSLCQSWGRVNDGQEEMGSDHIIRVREGFPEGI